MPSFPSVLPHHSRSAAPLRWLKQGEVRQEVALLRREVPHRTPEPLLAQLAAPNNERGRFNDRSLGKAAK